MNLTYLCLILILCPLIKGSESLRGTKGRDLKKKKKVRTNYHLCNKDCFSERADEKYKRCTIKCIVKDADKRAYCNCKPAENGSCEIGTLPVICRDECCSLDSGTGGQNPDGNGGTNNPDQEPGRSETKQCMDRCQKDADCKGGPCSLCRYVSKTKGNRCMPDCGETCDENVECEHAGPNCPVCTDNKCTPAPGNACHLGRVRMYEMNQFEVVGNDNNEDERRSIDVGGDCHDGYTRHDTKTYVQSGDSDKVTCGHFQRQNTNGGEPAADAADWVKQDDATSCELRIPYVERPNHSISACSYRIWEICTNPSGN